MAGILGIIAVVLLVYLGWLYREYLMSTVLPGSMTDQGRVTLPATSTPMVPDQPEVPVVTMSGAYINYADNILSSVQPETRVVLFFTRSDCSSCFEFEESVLSLEQTIPPELLIVRVEWSRNVSLRQQYDVSVPHTFVEVAPTGAVRQRWTGSQSLPALLSQLTRVE